MRTKSGTWHWILDRGKVVERGPDGRPLRMVGTHADITTRKDLEHRLRRSDELADQVSRLARIGGWEVDLYTKRVTWSREVHRIHEAAEGYQPTLDDVRWLFPPGYLESIEQDDPNGRVDMFDRELPLVTAKGRHIWVRVLGRTEIQEGRPGRVHGALQDITAQHQSETDRRQLELQLFQAQKVETLGTLSGGIAHDFNNLLMVILLNLELAQSRTPLNDEMGALLAEAARAAKTSGGLTQQLLTFAKGGAPIRKPIDLAGVIQEAVRLAVSGSRVRYDFNLARDLWLAEVDAGQIGQVIRNLALNAREAMPGGGVISVRAENVVLGPREHASLPPGEYVRVSLTDWGGGIAKEVLPKIFDPYFSTKQMGTQKGMGLGLTICHAVIQKHGGAIAAESEPGVGATFQLHLPASRRPLPPEAAAEPVRRARGGKILVMDDEEVVRNLIKRLLEQMCHEVAVEEEGQSAIEAYKAAKDQGRPYDAVLLDLTVRAGRGAHETIQELLKIDPAVNAIVMSGYANDPAVLEPEDHGFKGVLAKPFDRASLEKVLAGVLGTEGGR